MGGLARRFLADADELLLPHVIVAEIVHVLASYYELPRNEVAVRVGALLSWGSIVVADRPLLLRALELYELHRIGFPDAYLIASAERSGVGVVASFDKGIDRVGSVRRVEPT